MTGVLIGAGVWSAAAVVVSLLICWSSQNADVKENSRG